MPDERDKLKKPCAGCPFARATSPEYLRSRGRDVRRFIGQACAPFLLPCHHTADKEGWPLDPARPQCAGAAMYRDLTGVSHRMPDALTRLRGDPTLVFATPAEYLAHHDGITVAAAEELLRANPPEAYFLAEWREAQARAVRSG